MYCSLKQRRDIHVLQPQTADLKVHSIEYLDSFCIKRDNYERLKFELSTYCFGHH